MVYDCTNRLFHEYAAASYVLKSYGFVEFIDGDNVYYKSKRFPDRHLDSIILHDAEFRDGPIELLRAFICPDGDYSEFESVLKMAEEHLIKEDIIFKSSFLSSRLVQKFIEEVLKKTNLRCGVVDIPPSDKQIATYLFDVPVFIDYSQEGYPRLDRSKQYDFVEGEAMKFIEKRAENKPIVIVTDLCKSKSFGGLYKVMIAYFDKEVQ